MPRNKRIDRLESGTTSPKSPNDEVVWINTSNNTVSRYNESNSSWVAVGGSGGGGGISNVVEDTTPQLGGNLDVNEKDIVSTGGSNIQIVASADGDVILSASGTGIVSVTGDLAVGGDVSVGGDVNFGDNDKAIFGAGSDLQIYHSGTNSYIQENGTGSLIILGYDTKMTATGAATYLENTNTGYGLGEYGVKIRHITSGSTASEKFKTTSTGIDVTGNVVLTGNIQMNGNIVGVFRLQPQNNSMTEIFMPADADANTTPLELYAEGNAGIALTGGLRLNPDTVTGASDPLDAIIPKTISIAMLNVPDPSAAQFYLLDGFEGQILHLIPVSSASGDAGLISLTIDNYRFNSSGTTTVQSTSGSGNNFYPFSTGTAAMVTMVFASGAWQASQGQWI